MRKVNVLLKNKSGTEVLYEEISKVKLKTSDGEAVFSLGKPDEIIIDPDFSNGDVTSIAPDDVLYEKVVVKKPQNLLPENIGKDIVIAGIKGTFEGKQELPKLYAPSISRSGDEITISNSGNNGAFNKLFNVYSNDEYYLNQTGKALNIPANFEAERDYKIEATCNNPLMEESDKSNSLSFSVFSINKIFDENVSTSDTIKSISDGLPYSLVAKCSPGFWLPENVEVYEKRNGANQYVPYNFYDYSMYTGIIQFDGVYSNLKIVVNADDEPILKRPNVDLKEDFTFDMSYPIYAEKLLVYIDDNLVEEDNKEKDLITFTTSNVGTYGFTINSDGYYWPDCKGINNGSSIVRLEFVNNSDDTKVSFYWMQNSESNYDFGLVGVMDSSLDKSNSTDANVLLNAKGKTQTTPAVLELDVPKGTHFYDVKYRKDSSVNNGWDAFIFKVECGDGIRTISSDEYRIVEFTKLYLCNVMFENGQTPNVKHHIYIDDEEVIAVKEGI